MASGKVKKVIVERGFGFISPADGGQDVFFHCSALPDKSVIDTLEEGTPVEYETEAADDGRVRASSVRIL